MQSLFDPPSHELPRPLRVLTVSELNREARAGLERCLPLLWVGGEVSGFVRHSSGHCYFTLKDRDSQVSCVLFRQRAQQLDWLPRNGAQVELLALVTLYEPRGQFQLNVETLRPAGLGALYEAFERLKAKLEGEGLFDPQRKRPLPSWPRAIGVATSREAAALRDFLTTLARRMPGIPVVIYPAPVQGDGAAERIARAIRVAGERAECDVLVVCRGGGSIEDLWAFNDERVARAIAASPIPVVSGVGHETDFTIADFVADLRAATPTAAAELVSPNRSHLAAAIETARMRLVRAMARRVETLMQRLDYLGRHLVPPGERLRRQRVEVDQRARRLQAAMHRALEGRGRRIELLANRLHAATPEVSRFRQHVEALSHRLTTASHHGIERRRAVVQRFASQLTHLNPREVLARGYCIARKEDGFIVRSANAIENGARLSLTFAQGDATVRVEEKGQGQ